MLQVTVNNSTMKWYAAHGYVVPSRAVQLYVKSSGVPKKNGFRQRVARGTTILIDPKDLMPGSNVSVPFNCATCGELCTTQWRGQRIKMSLNCVSCQAKKGFKGGCHAYWVQKLITENTSAKCDIGGDTDKRFLELHHLVSRSVGGKDERSNYVVLCANYHRAFHNWMGGSNVPCNADDYVRFRELELREQEV